MTHPELGGEKQTMEKKHFNELKVKFGDFVFGFDYSRQIGGVTGHHGGY